MGQSRHQRPSGAAIEEALPVALRLALWGSGVGILVGLVGQLVAPFHVPGHEFAQAGAVVGGLCQIAFASTSLRSFAYRPDRLEAALLASFGSLLGFGFGLHGVAVLANELRHGCDLSQTGLFLWLTWLPLGVFATVFGLATVGLRLVPRILWLVGLVVVCVAHDEWRFAQGLRTADPLIGFLLGLDQRADMTLTAPVVLQRGWLLGMSLSAWAVVRWQHHRNGVAATVAGVTSALMLVATISWGGRIGLGVGRGAQAVLDGHAESEHVVVRFDRSGRARHFVPAVLREAEWGLHRLTRAWRVSLDGVRVTLDVYDNDQALLDATGRHSAHAVPWQTSLTYRDAFRDTLHHELVHAIDSLAGQPPWIGDPIRGRVEGSAVAWTDGYAVAKAPHAPLAVAAAEGRLPSAATLMSLSGFWTVNEGTAYRSSGSFVGFLIQRYGVERWRRWLATQSVTQAYDADLASLDAEWRTFLASVPTRDAARQQARRLFDPRRRPAATKRKCPKLGPRVPALAEHADEARRAGDYEGALVAYRAMYAEDRDPTSWWSVVGQLQQLGRHDEVASMLGAVDAEWAGPVALADAQIGALLEQPHRAAAALEDAIAARVALEPHDQLAAALRLLATPELSAVVPQLLRRSSPRDGARAQALAGRLREQHPEYAADLRAMTLDTSLGLPWPGYQVHLSDGHRREVADVLQGLAAGLGCDQQGRAWVRTARALIQMGECDLASAWVRALRQACDEPDLLWRLDQLNQRLDWEARQPEPHCDPTIQPRNGP